MSDAIENRDPRFLLRTTVSSDPVERLREIDRDAALLDRARRELTAERRRVVDRIRQRRTVRA